MVTMFARHEVEDFGKWKAAYDAFDKERKTMGVTGDGVYRADDDPNNVTIYHRFANVDTARKFAGSARLKEVMKGAGVVGSPDIWITNEA